MRNAQCSREPWIRNLLPRPGRILTNVLRPVLRPAEAIGLAAFRGVEWTAERTTHSPGAAAEIVPQGQVHHRGKLPHIIGGVNFLLLGNSNDAGQWFEDGKKRHEIVAERLAEEFGEPFASRFGPKALQSR